MILPFILIDKRAFNSYVLEQIKHFRNLIKIHGILDKETHACWMQRTLKCL